MGSLTVSPRAAGVPVELCSAHPGAGADGELLRVSGEQFYVASAATVPNDGLALDESAAVWGSGVHAVAADHGSKAEATGRSSL